MKTHTDADSITMLQILSVLKKLQLIDRTIYDDCRSLILAARGCKYVK